MGKPQRTPLRANAPVTDQHPCISTELLWPSALQFKPAAAGCQRCRAWCGGVVAFPLARMAGPLEDASRWAPRTRQVVSVEGGPLRLHLKFDKIIKLPLGVAPRPRAQQRRCLARALGGDCGG